MFNVTLSRAPRVPSFPFPFTSFSSSSVVIMVNWSGQHEITEDYNVFQRLIYTFFGLYIWELFVTADFEWALITKRRRFRWPMVFFQWRFPITAANSFAFRLLFISLISTSVFFFFARYCILLAFVGLIVSFTVTTKINCSALYTFNSWCGNMAILCASTSLMVRTIALWERRTAIVVPLIVFCIAHWAVLYRGMFIVQAAWDDTLQVCAVTATDPSLLKITFFFTMGFDFVILCFTSVALLHKHSVRTDLWKLLFQDGLVYFLVSFTTNSIPAILNVLDLNTPMNVIATVPAAAVSCIAACRAVIRLQEFAASDVYVHSMTNITQQKSFNVPKPPRFSSRPQVHVTTEHITMAEFPSPTSGASPHDLDSPYFTHLTDQAMSLSDQDVETDCESEKKFASAV